MVGLCDENDYEMIHFLADHYIKYKLKIIRSLLLHYVEEDK